MQNHDSIAKKNQTFTYYKTPAGILEATFEGETIIKAVFVEMAPANTQLQSIASSPAIAMHGTEFQVKVWQTACQIPAGSTTSYKELAISIGHPTSWRAVANALGDNKIAYFIPCHRVVGSNGNVSGYKWGSERKKMLLETEGALNKMNHS